MSADLQYDVQGIQCGEYYRAGAISERISERELRHLEIWWMAIFYPLSKTWRVCILFPSEESLAAHYKGIRKWFYNKHAAKIIAVDAYVVAAVTI